MEWHKCRLSKDKLEGITSVGDLYNVIGFDELFQSGRIKDVRQMAISKKTFEELGNIMGSNWRIHEKGGFLREDKVKAIIAFDWMNYSPVCNEEVPEWEIWWHE